MADEISSIIHTGNLLRLPQFHTKNGYRNSGHKNAELVDALKQLQIDNKSCYAHLTTDRQIQLKNIGQNDQVKISTKIFLSNDAEPTIILKAVDKLLLSMENYKSLDVLILSFPNFYAVEDMLKYYRVAETLVNNGKLANIGVADLCIDRIQKLESLVEIPPQVIQLNFAYHKQLCQSKLVEYAHKRDILTLVHTDLSPFITAGQINSILGVDRVKTVNTVLKYNVTAKFRCVLLAKGYHIFLEHEK